MQQRALNCLSFWNQTSLAAYSCQLYLPTTYFSRGRFISPRLAPWSVKQEWMTELWGQQMGAALGLAPKAPLAELTWCCSRGHFPLVLLSWEWLKNQKGRQDKRWPGPFLLPQCLCCHMGCIVESQDLEMECFSPWLVLFFLIVSLSCISGLRPGIYLQPGVSAPEAVYHQPLLYKYWTIDFFFSVCKFASEVFYGVGQTTTKRETS